MKVKVKAAAQLPRYEITSAMQSVGKESIQMSSSAAMSCCGGRRGVIGCERFARYVRWG
jgi:hypothetical protein